MMIRLSDCDLRGWPLNVPLVKIGIVGTFVVLSACACPVIDPLMLPLSVDEAIPSDIDRSEVNRDPDGCYFYTFAAELIVVRDRNGAPICIPA